MRAKIITACPSFFNSMYCLSFNKACHCLRMELQYFAWVFLLPENRDDCDGIWFANLAQTLLMKKRLLTRSQLKFYDKSLQRHPQSACFLIFCVQTFTEWIYSHGYNTVCSNTGNIQILDLQASHSEYGSVQIPDKLSQYTEVIWITYCTNISFDLRSFHSR